MPSNSLASVPGSIKARQLYPENFHGEEGAYVQLEHGRVRYWFKGPPDGKRIVLVPGLSVPSLIWSTVILPLVENGYRTLIYDLYGRGYSDAPHVTYTTELFTTQLASLMKHIGWDKAIIVGLSMGGGIAAGFAAKYPEMVDEKMILLAPAGLLKIADAPIDQRALLSGPAGFVLSLAPIRWLLQRRMPKSKPDVSKEEATLNMLAQQQAAYLPHYLSAVASSYHHGPILDTPDTRAAFSACSKFKVLIVWGTADTVVPFTYSEEVKHLVGSDNLTFKSIEGANHDITVTHSTTVSEFMLEFLSA
jgi:pimeloyl-ACP methyl ester carboxylesterase